MLGNAPDPLTTSTAPAGKPYALVVLLQLHWFIRLRWLFAAGALAALLVERFMLLAASEERRPLELWLVVLGVAAVNLVWTAVSRLFRRQLDVPERHKHRTIRTGQFFVSVQIATDLLLLTCILALTGGVENPMSLFYLFHVAITGLLLRTWQALIQSCWAVLLYATMCIGQSQGWLDYYPFLPHLGTGAGLHDDPQHVIVVVTVVALAIFGTLYFMDRIGRVLDRREAMLVEKNAALEMSQQAIRDLQRRRSRFMQTAAHQLKSPLAMVQTLANLIRDNIVTDEAGIQATCEKVVRRSRDGIAQVTELLALARVQEADPHRHRESLSNVGQVVADLCRKHALVAKDKNLHLQWQIPKETELLAYVHQTDLADCINNLIENAIKYTPDGGSIGVIVLCGARSSIKDELPPPPATHSDGCGVDDFIYVIVKDTGIGIEEKVLAQKGGTGAADSLFDAFRRGNRALAAGIPGTGLGLSIVREVVEQAGGFIHVHSRPGKGSTFTISFPAQGSGPGEVVRDTRSSEIVVEHEAADS
ncbi:MAG: HAMP domain-containing histidine kinase [Phycisphaerae bacterium]|nr:HAMP domain-containing histidine kinase [Phycisphaerae bacterium]